MAELIPAGTGESDWADFTVSNAPAGVFIKGASSGDMPGGCSFLLAHKSGSVRTNLRYIDPSNLFENGSLSVPGTFSIKRVKAPVSAGLDVEGAD